MRAFYQAWTNFTTEKDFAWKDLYKVEEEMPRWQRREIEKENQRARQTAKREYNDAVRVRNRGAPTPDLLQNQEADPAFLIDNNNHDRT